MEKGPISPDGIALAAAVLVNVLIKTLMDRGLLSEEDRRDIADRALVVIEAFPPTGTGAETLVDARRWLEGYL